MSLALVLPLVILNGSPCVKEGQGCFLIDTGAAISAAKAVHGPFSEFARENGVSQEIALTFPPGLDGILGWDWIRSTANSRVEFMLGSEAALLLDEEPSKQNSVQVGKFENKLVGSRSRGSAPGELPCVELALYGVSSGSGVGVVDTGSPVSIVSPLLADGAALFDEAQLSDEVQTLMTTGAFIGGGIQASSCVVYSGEVPLMASTGMDALLGMDLLGQNFALGLDDSTLQVW